MQNHIRTLSASRPALAATHGEKIVAPSPWQQFLDSLLCLLTGGQYCKVY